MKSNSVSLATQVLKYTLSRALFYHSDANKEKVNQPLNKVCKHVLNLAGSANADLANHKPKPIPAWRHLTGLNKLRAARRSRMQPATAYKCIIQIDFSDAKTCRTLYHRFGASVCNYRTPMLSRSRSRQRINLMHPEGNDERTEARAQSKSRRNFLPAFSLHGSASYDYFFKPAGMIVPSGGADGNRYYTWKQLHTSIMICNYYF